MNTPTKVCLGVSAALLVASAGGMTAANACPESDAPKCDVVPAAPAAAPQASLLRVAAPSSRGAVISTAVLTPDAPRPAGAVSVRNNNQSTAWTFDDDGDSARQVAIVSTGDGETFDVRVKDGDVIVKRNGKKIDASRIKLQDEQVIILDDNGNKVREFQIRPHASAPSAPAAPKAFFPGEGGTWVSAGANDAYRTAARVNAPSVMVGIHQSEVPAAVRWHLGLGDDTPAIMIERVIDGLPAARAGLKTYDVIVSIDGSDGASGQTLSKVLREKNPGDGLKLYVISKGDKKKVELELVKYDQSSLSGGEIAFAPSGIGRVFSNDGGDFVFDVAPEDIEFDFKFDNHQNHFNHKMHEELARKREAILREFENHSDLEHRDHDRARIALEKAMTDLDSNLAERVEMAERQAQEARKHVMELRGNRLVLPDRFADRATELHRKSAEGLEGRLEQLEARLEEMHVVLERQMDRMMERMSRMLEEVEHEMHEDHDG